MVTQSDVQGWAGGLDDVLDRIGSRFGRAEPRRRAAAYLRGLLAPVERKNDGFFTAGDTPRAAAAQLAPRWPALRFVLRPRPG